MGKHSYFSLYFYVNVNVFLWEGYSSLWINVVHLKRPVSGLHVNYDFPGQDVSLTFNLGRLIWEAGHCATCHVGCAHLHGEKWMQRHSWSAPSIGYGQVTSFSDCFLRVALSGLGSKLFKNYWWILDSKFNVFFTFRIWNAFVRKKTLRWRQCSQEEASWAEWWCK